MSHPNKRRLAALAAGSATAVLASATTGLAPAGAAPTAAAPNARATTSPTTSAPGSKLSVSTNRPTSKARFSYGRAHVAAKGQHVAAAKVTMPGKKKKKKGKGSRVS